MVYSKKRMCFSIPIRVLKVVGRDVWLETGAHIKMEKNMDIKTGSYVRLAGDTIVDCLSLQEGDSIRELIAELNTNYED